LQNAASTAINSLLPGSAAASAATSAATTSVSTWTQLFLRAVVIIVGFIFLAVGLSMFKEQGPAIVNETGRHVKNLGKKVVGKK
jgi:hypothetical protein